jgi:hypothetical protein
MVLLNMPPNLVVDAFGLPGDAPSDMPHILSTISCILDKTGIRRCLVSDILLIPYNVPKIMAVRANFTLSEVFNTRFNFCSQIVL